MHQTEFQRQMLGKYGRTIVGMDATYKVCKWSFPFFLLTVVTNHGHAVPVAMFFLENESGKGIAEALSIIRTWNPDWRPAYLMVDKDAKEENAINEVRGATACFSWYTPPRRRPPTWCSSMTCGPSASLPGSASST